MTDVDGRALNTSESNPAQVSIPYPPKEYDLYITQVVVGPPGPPGPSGVPPLVTADTATVDLTGAGVTGDPLTADVKASSVGIVASDTATVDFTGAGTAASPLTADVKANSVGIVANDTATVDLTGTGTAASPLTADVKPGQVLIAVADTAEVDLTNTAGTVSAALTGTRAGSWAVTGSVTADKGSVQVGDFLTESASDFERRFLIRRLIGTDKYEAMLMQGTGAYCRLTTYLNAVAAAELRLHHDGHLSTFVGGTSERPIPFAMYVYGLQLTFANAATAQQAVTYPVGRFTQAPQVVASSHGSSTYFGWSNGATVSGVTVGLSHRDGTATSISTAVAMYAVQMTPTSTVGRALDEPVENVNVTCHEPGCHNEGAVIALAVEPGTPVVCGPCGQPITDIEPVTPR